jgi:hypothetical protein
MMPRLNYPMLLQNLSEAREELEHLEQALQGPEPLSEAELRIGLEHALHHLSFAWNARRAGLERHARLSDADFNRWSKLPRDLKPYSVPVRRRRRPT